MPEAEPPLPRCDFESRSLILRLETTLPADPKRIAPVVEGVMALVTQMGCAAGKEFEVETALHEALANAVLHGCGGDSSKQVQFSVSCDEARGMLIVVRDPGPGFDPDSLPSPITGEQIYSTHGRGIYLINRLMDEVRFERGGTEIHMMKA
ncbi:MAG TPA: ATP-binding protein [Candidatus Polarisedimenticolia bacterium]|jgi:serine/threonine-protein kinase RsbW